MQSIGKSGWPVRDGVPAGTSDRRGGGSRGRRRPRGDNGFGDWGGYMSAKKAKLADQFNAGKQGSEATAKPKGIFHGVSIFVNGYTVPSADELKRQMMVHDGDYHHYYSLKRTTHIVATNLPYAKIKELKGEKVVRPEWIVDSIAAGRLLDWQDYQLYRDLAQKNKLNFAKVSNGPASVEQGAGTTSNGSGSVSADGPDGKLLVDVKEEPKPSSVPAADEDEDELVYPSDDERERAKRRRVADGDEDLFAGDSSSEKNVVLRDVKNEVLSNGDERGEWKPSTRLRHEVASDDAVLFDDDEDSKSMEAWMEKYSTPLDLEGDEERNPFQAPVEEDPPEAARDCPEEDPCVSPDGNKKREPAAKKDDGRDGRRVPKPILAEFYGRSRLHHISTMGTFFKDYVAELRETGDTSFPGIDEFRHSLPSTSAGVPKMVGVPKGRIVMHIDMDCFFVSVGLKKHPELRGKPVAVTHSRATGGVQPRGQNIQLEKEIRDQRRGAREAKRKGGGEGQGDAAARDDESESELESTSSRGRLLDNRSSTSEVSSCSYEARAKGVRNGMYLGEAVKLCPDLIPIPYDFEGYTEVSKMLYDTIARYTHNIEAVSCDEMFVDLTSVLQATGASCLDFAAHLRRELFEKTQCQASAGLGPNMLIARLATRVAKPNGQHYVPQSDASEFLVTQTVRDLPGVGWSTSNRVEEKFHAKTCGDLQRIPLTSLRAEFGPKTGQKLYNFCRGLDDRPIAPVHERKSVSAGMNYAIRFTTHKEAEDFIRDLAAELCSRMERISVRCRALTLKLAVRAAGAPAEPVKFMGTGVCDYPSRQTNLLQPTRDPDVIQREAWKLYKLLDVVPSDLRGLNLQGSKLESTKAGVHSRVGAEDAHQPKMSDFLKTKQPAAAAAPAAAASPAKTRTSSSVPASPDRATSAGPSSSVFGSPARKAGLNPFYEKLMNPLSPGRMKTSPARASPKRNQGNKASPKRGGVQRARRGRPRALNVADGRQKDIRAAFGGNVQTVNAQSTGNNPGPSSSSAVPADAPRRPASINGLREVEDVKVLLRQWVEHCGDGPPLQEDVERLATFLADLCREREVCDVDALLKYFRRLLCDGRGSVAMKEAYLDLALCVSQETVAAYGAPLYYRKDFD